MELLGHEIHGWTYMMASGRIGTIYTGSTTKLSRRAWEHREKIIPGLTKTYGVVRLVWFEPHTSIVAAANRERRIKRWRRAWKIALIEKENPLWRDLFDEINEI